MSDLHPALADRGASPLLVAAPLSRPRLLWPLLRLGLALFLLWFLASIGFGELGGGWSIQGDQMGLIAGLVLGWGLTQLLQNLALALWHRAVDWVPGLYLFEAGLVDASSPQLHRLAMDELERIRVVRDKSSASREGGGLELVFVEGGRAFLPVGSGDAAERMGERVRALATEDSPWGTESVRAPLARRDSRKLTPHGPLWPQLTALLLGLIVGLTVWSHRDRLSDDLAFEAAEAQGGSGAYRLYMRHVGGRHSEEVLRQRLPLSSFTEAQSERSMEALMRWKTEFPGAAQESFFVAAQQELYQAARESLVQLEGVGGDSAATGRNTLSALLDYQERSGSPPLSLRFEEGASAWLDDVDETLGGTHDGRPVARAGRHVRGIPEERRKRYLADAIEEGVQLLLGSRLLYLDLTGGPENESEPSLWVKGSVHPGTSVFEAEGRDELFIELYLGVQLVLSVPGTEGVTLELSLSTPDTFVAPDEVERETSTFAQVYEAMLRRVMDGLSSAFAEAFGGSKGAIVLEVTPSGGE